MQVSKSYIFDQDVREGQEKKIVSIFLEKLRKIYLNFCSSCEVTGRYSESKALYTTLETQSLWGSNLILNQ